MGRELGRISGPLLADNLLRNGKNLAFESKLLYLDVTNKRIGINSSIPTRDLSITGTGDSINLIADSAILADLEVSLHQIQNVTGEIVISPNQLLNPTVKVPELKVSNLQFTSNNITNTDSEGSITLTTNNGSVIFNTSSLEIDGNLHATGDITWDGNVTFGSDSVDNVEFNSDINSDLIPDETNFYNLGSGTRVWNDLYTTNVPISNLIADTLFVDGLDMLLSPSNTVYVSVNGSDSSIGTHIHAPVKTIKHALSIAQSGQEIVVFPGDYVEEFPLEIPQGVSVRGMGIRAVTVKPTIGTEYSDCFLLNGETTVSFLTIKDFFYSSSNNTGYAFKLAPGMHVTTRSPYVFNVSVITNGSVTTQEDPKGFSQGDAGGGAYIDGSVVDPVSNQASCLFYATTFITPNQDALIALNGARIEWLNSFTYFAKRGFYLRRGSTGFANQGNKFGAELRSINSASFYGTYGAVADGANTIGYLIGHNFGYIGSADNASNTASLTITSNEVLELNGGIIYYETIDQSGAYKVGDVFSVSQQTGIVEFNTNTFTISDTGSILLDSNTGATYVNSLKLDVGNLEFYANNVDSVLSDVNFKAFSGNTYLNTDVNITGNIDVTGDALIKGKLILGDQPTDTVTIYDRLTQTIKPDLPNTFDLGKITGTPKVWNVAYLTSLNVDDVVQIANNTVSTLTTDTNLILSAATTGIVNVQLADVIADQDLTVTGNTDLQNLSITGLVNLTGNYTQLGTVDRTGNTNITGSITVNGPHFVQFEDIKFQDNKISTTLTNSNLVLDSNGTGILNVTNTDVVVENNVNVAADISATSVVNTNVVTANSFNFGDIYIINNQITVTGTSVSIILDGGNAAGAFLDNVNGSDAAGLFDNVIDGQLNLNLELYANGTGKIYIPSNDVLISNNLSVNGLTNTTDISITGPLGLTGDYNQTGDANRTGNTNITGSLTVNGSNFVQFDNIKFESNNLFTTITDSDLILDANGTGIVNVTNTDVTVGQDVNVTIDVFAGSVNTTNQVTGVDFYPGDFHIYSNYIDTVNTNQNFILSANGNGVVTLQSSDVYIPNNITIAGPFTVNGSSTILETVITGNIVQTGNIFQTGNLDIIGNVEFGGDIVTNSNTSVLTLPQIVINADNIIQVTAIDTDLMFRANGTGGVRLERYLQITDNEIRNIFDQNDITLAYDKIILAEDGQTLITENEETILVDSIIDGDLSVILTPNGTGNVVVNTTTAIAIAYGDDNTRILRDVGEIRQNSTSGIYEGKLATGLARFNNVYSGDLLTNITAELTPGANDDTIRFTANSIVSTSEDSTKLFNNNLQVNNINVFDDTIRNSVLSHNLIFSPTGSGTIKFNNISLAVNEIRNNTNDALVLNNTGDGYVHFTGTNGVAIPSGDDAGRYITPELGETRFNTERSYSEIWDGTQWIAVGGSSNYATLEEIEAELDIWSIVLG